MLGKLRGHITLPPPMPVTHHPENRGTFPGASPGCGKWKFPAMSHLLTPSVEVFRLVAAPHGVWSAVSHTLLGRPRRDPHTAPGAVLGPWFVQALGSSNPMGEALLQCSAAGQRDRRAAPHRDNCLLFQPLCLDGCQELLPAPKGASLPAMRLFFGQNRTDYMAQLTPAP